MSTLNPPGLFDSGRGRVYLAGDYGWLTVPAIYDSFNTEVPVITNSFRTAIICIGKKDNFEIIIQRIESDEYHPVAVFCFDSLDIGPPAGESDRAVVRYSVNTAEIYIPVIIK